nr:MBL fold metallo-hydrolase [Mycolicibacterium komanii]CRL76229.1 Zn-dependent hydrolase [Mycolicibacterium komanii]
MKVHHLNCGSMHPYGVPVLVCHVLVIETDNGLVLVDSGYGLADCDDPARRTGPTRRFFRPFFDRDETAIRQVERLGFRREDVRHIVVTHFDVDHIGGLSDFPDAEIHCTAAEVLGAMHPPTRAERFRFRSAQWDHGPKIVEHTPDGDKWRGFAAAKELTEISPGIVLISLPGHTRGHACVAVDAGHRWLLHCGDAFYHPDTIGGPPRIAPALAAFEKVAAFNRKQVRDNHARLTELYRRSDPDLLLLCSHDPGLLQYAQETA